MSIVSSGERDNIDRTMKAGAFRRSLRITGAPGRTRGEMEDDFHHFALTIVHDGEVVLSVEVETIRIPWVTCEFASRVFEDLVGQRLDAVRLADERRQAGCTHLYDLAILVAAHALRGTARIEMRMEVATSPLGGEVARLVRDGELVLDWRVDAGVILEGPLAGIRLEELGARVRGRMAPEDYEAATALRRAIRIAGGRRVDKDKVATVAEISEGLRPTCYTLLPENRARAARIRGATIDFSAGRRWPLE